MGVAEADKVGDEDAVLCQLRVVVDGLLVVLGADRHVEGDYCHRLLPPVVGVLTKRGKKRATRIWRSDSSDISRGKLRIRPTLAKEVRSEL